MALEPDVLSGKSTNVDHTEQVCFAGLYCHSEVLGLIEQSSLWHGLCTGRVVLADEAGEQVRHLVMVPVRDGEDKLLVVLAFEWRVWVIDDEWPAQTVWVLAHHMAVIPVRAGLANGEVVREATLWWNRTLSCTDGSIHVVCTIP